MEKLILLPIDSVISEMSVKLVEDYSLSHKLSLPDAIIGATSIYHKIELYTLNVKDFRFLDEVKLFSI
jgi:predicted nucleic acid-binding protein